VEIGGAIEDAFPKSYHHLEGVQLMPYVVELTIAKFHSGLREGTVTCRGLVGAYLRRIEEYDQPTGLNAFVVLNPNALNRAGELDAEIRRTGKLRPLHGVPAVIKDNYDTHDLQTAAGSLAMKGSLPPDDASQVRRLREVGAVVLGKSNMAEWAFSPYHCCRTRSFTVMTGAVLGLPPLGPWLLYMGWIMGLKAPQSMSGSASASLSPSLAVFT